MRACPATTAIVAGTAPDVADRLLDLAGDPQVVRPGQAVADDGALQRDDRPSGGERVRDLGMDLHYTASGDSWPTRAG